MKKEIKIAKHCECLVSRTIKSKAYVSIDNKGEIVNCEPYGNPETLKTEILSTGEIIEPGINLIRDVEIAITVAKSAINRYGKKYVELLINKEVDEIYVHYHDKHNSTALYTLDYSSNDEFMVNYIKEEFKKAGIDVCKY